MEIFKTSNVYSPSAMSGALVGSRSAAAASTWTPFGHEGGARVLAPVVATAQGTALSIASRDRIDVRTTALDATATALLPTNVYVDIDGDAGIRTWDPPV